ncbi:MAG TPA: response regulator [Nitrospirota bacterium]|nr:response regulator [Nitrospirota bacterium]
MAEEEVHSIRPQVAERPKRLVVVVDNDGAHLYYTSMLLQRLEYSIHTSKNAEDALEIIGVAEPSLVLTEITLAGINGLELLKKIKRNPQTHKVPVIILTSSKDQVLKSACLDEGCTAYFQKPVDSDILYAAIQKATESKPRQFIRLQTCLNVMVGEDKSAQTSVISDYITALSEQGMFVSTSQPKPVGLQIPITIFLEDEKIVVEAMVLYSFKREEGPLKTSGMGIKFVRIKPEDQRLIRVFIKKEITKGLTLGQIGGTIL